MEPEAAAHAAAEAGTEAAGMPQLDFSTFPNQIFWLLVALGAIWLIVTRIAVPRVGAVLAERRGTISNDLAAAEDLRQKAVVAEKAYDKALADARSESARIIAAAKADIKRDLDAATQSAEAELAAKTDQSALRIGEIRDSAVASVGEVARDTAAAIVAAFGGAADQATIDAAVAAQLERVTP